LTHAQVDLVFKVPKVIKLHSAIHMTNTCETMYIINVSKFATIEAEPKKTFHI